MAALTKYLVYSSGSHLGGTDAGGIAAASILASAMASMMLESTTMPSINSTVCAVSWSEAAAAAASKTLWISRSRLLNLSLKAGFCVFAMMR